MVEVVKQRFGAMVNDPAIAPSLSFFKDNIILTTIFADAAPESKKKVMTNSYLRFLNFIGVGSSPAMMPWLNGGNFKEVSDVFKWLHDNVINKDIEALENLRIPVQLQKEKEMTEVKFVTLPVGDLSYQSKVAGHQGCASTYFSVYWADLTKRNGGDKREEMQRRDLEWMKEQVKKAVKKENELDNDPSLSDQQKKAHLQDYVSSECHNQAKLPWLLICERFTPDGPLHGKCSAVLALMMAVLEGVCSNEHKDGLLHRITSAMEQNNLHGFANTIEKQLIEDKKSTYQFRLLGAQANIILQKFHRLVVNPILEYFANNNFELSRLMSLRLQAFSFCCRKLKEMSCLWEVLKYKKKDEKEQTETEMTREEVEECLEEMAQMGRDVIRCFKMFFSEIQRHSMVVHPLHRLPLLCEDPL